MRSMLVTRAVLAGAFIVLGFVVIARVALFIPHAGLKIIPGLVLGFAMIALGAHRIALIRRVL